MEKIKQYKYIILIIIVILGLVFYWYSLRPSIIKKGCYNEAKEKAIKKFTDSNLERLTGNFTKDDYDTYYKWCLQEKGL